MGSVLSGQIRDEVRRRVLDEGQSQRAVAREMGIDRATVRTMVNGTHGKKRTYMTKDQRARERQLNRAGPERLSEMVNAPFVLAEKRASWGGELRLGHCLVCGEKCWFDSWRFLCDECDELTPGRRLADRVLPHLRTADTTYEGVAQ